MTGDFAKKTLTVGELNRYIKLLIASDDKLSALWLQGEISNLKYHSSGHVYFSLRDEDGAVVKSVMFRSRSMYLRFRLEEGMKVLAFGNVDVFEQGGQYQFYVEKIEPDGLGALYAAFERLKAKLSAEGLFDENRKRKIPLLPNCVGVVTSPTGAVIRDIKKVAGRRFPEIPIMLYDAPVQGREAAPLIAEAIRKAGSEGKCDVVIVARGGGSIEDLWPFNEECVARAIFDCPVPVISAVGHETDFTIADFVADMRAPTPSAAAELAFPEKAALKANLADLKARLKAAPGVTAMMKRSAIDRYILRLDFAYSAELTKHKMILQSLDRALQTYNPENVLIKKQGDLERLKARIAALGEMDAEKRKAKVRIMAEKLAALGPASVLSRGYSYAVSEKGTPLSSAKDFHPGQGFRLVMADGSVDAVVSESDEKAE